MEEKEEKVTEVEVNDTKDITDKPAPVQKKKRKTISKEELEKASEKVEKQIQNDHRASVDIPDTQHELPKRKKPVDKNAYRRIKPAKRLR